MCIVQVRADTSLGAEYAGELASLDKLVEENQFVAHANSILETEEITDKVRQISRAMTGL